LRVGHHAAVAVARFAWRVYERDLCAYNADGNLTSRVYADEGDGLDDWAFSAKFDEGGMQTERGVQSPSGVFAASVYREVDKNPVRTVAGTAPSQPRPERFRRAAVELPLTFAAR
jgi:hypothetical protein